MRRTVTSRIGRSFSVFFPDCLLFASVSYFFLVPLCLTSILIKVSAIFHLSVINVLINLIVFQKVFMGVKTMNLSIFQNKDTVRILYAGDTLRDDQFGVSGISSAKALRILASVAVSTALVLSSKIKIFGFFSNALAMQRRCFCPPDTLEPPCSI